MRCEDIQEGFEVFAHDGDKVFGAVREVGPHGKPELLVYVENAGDFTVSFDAVLDVHAGKVVVNCAKLDQRLREAIGHAHDAEDPNI